MSRFPITFQSSKGPWDLTEDIYKELCEDFPEMDVLSCILDARAWHRSLTPQERKTNMRKFIANWLIKNRREGVHLKIVSREMPSFSGTSDHIKRCEYVWRKNMNMTEAEVYAEVKRLREAEPQNITSIGDILRKAGQ